MSAPAIPDLTLSQVDRGPVLLEVPEPHRIPSTVSITVNIDLHGQPLPPAALGLFESLRALAGVTVDGAPIARTVVSDAPADAATPGERRPAGDPSWAADVVLLESLDQRPDAEPPAPVAVGPRRSRVLRRATETAAPSGTSLRIYLASRMVLRDGVPVRLTRREYDLLVFLCQHPQRVFSRGQLLRQVWGYEMVSGERTVDVHVRRLRVKLGERGPVIATIRGVGYRLDDASAVTLLSDPR